VPTWSELLAELQPGGLWSDPTTGAPDLDGMRRHWIKQLSTHTGRNTVVYATDFLSPTKSSSPDLSINLGDMQGLMEVFKDLDIRKGLDLVLHSPGGDPTAADSLVRYMRDRFVDVRVIVPIAAMSAATMWSLSADVIVMGQHSQLGPIDPQLNLSAGMVPAGAIKRNFLKAQKECAEDERRLSAWVPTLQQYFPGLLEMCDDFSNLSKVLVGEYLARYMFKRRANREELAKAAADFFANDELHMAHGRAIGRDKVTKLGIRVERLENDPLLQDLVLSVHHSLNHTFSMTPVVKIIENQLERTWLRMM
jgi:hypothetical protein